MRRTKNVADGAGDLPRRAPEPLAEPVRTKLRTDEELMISLPSSTGKLSITPRMLFDLGSAKYMVCELKLHSLIDDGLQPSRLVSIAQKSGRPRPGECTAFRFGRRMYAMRIDFIRSMGDGTAEQSFEIETTSPETLELPLGND